MHAGDIIDEVAQLGFDCRRGAVPGGLFSCLLDDALDSVLQQEFFP